MIDWSSLVRDHGPAVWRTTFRLLGSRADADECFQETFASALALTRRSDDPIRAWRPLLTRLAVARGVDRLRQRVRRTAHEDAGADPAFEVDRAVDSQPADVAEHAELSARLRVALSLLPSKQADAFCLHCLEGWSYREVAVQLDVTTEHVGVLVHRARAALRARIDAILSNDIEAATGLAADPRSSAVRRAERGEP